jgi:hypothetical protein
VGMSKCNSPPHALHGYVRDSSVTCFIAIESSRQDS